MNTIVYGYHNNYGGVFQSNIIVHNKIFNILLESTYMTQYLYLLILLTEINCRKQTDSNFTIDNNILPSSLLTKSITNRHNSLNKHSMRSPFDIGQIQTNHNDDISTNNDPTSSTTIQLAFIVIEEVKIGSLVGNLLDKLHLQNPNWLITNSLTNSASQSNNNPFVNLKPIPYISLNQTTGDLTVRTRIDRETLCDTAGTCCHSERQVDYNLWSTSNHDNKLQIMNNDKLIGPLSMISPNCALRMLVLFHTDSEQFLEIVIYIMDINDNSPRWVKSVIELEIPEHTAIGTGYQLPEAIDPDQGPMHTVVAYELENKSLKEHVNQINKDFSPNQSNRDIQLKQPFSLDVRALDNSDSETQKFSLRLRIEEDLDRETQPVYELILYAIDGGETVQAHSEKHYTPGGTYSLPNVSNRHTGSVLIRVLLMDKNDNAPVFKNPDQVVIIPENTKPGTVIYKASASDMDSSDHNSLVYKIGPSASAEVLRCFRLNSETGELILIMPLSYQNASVLSLDNANLITNLNNRVDTTSPISQIGHRIPIQVSDQIHITKMTLMVSIQKINMNPPTIHIASHLRVSSRGNHIWISEDAQLGSLVAMINVIDADDIMPQSRSNQFLGREVKSECRSKHDSFEVVPLHTMTNSDFKILLKKPLDRETKSSHSVKIECWDSGEPPLTAEASIIIQVDDVNDSPPVFDRQFYFSKIKEGLDPSTPIIQVHATDADLGKNAEIIYRLVSQEYTLAVALQDTICSSFNSLHTENNLISINENTGELISQIALDRESIAVINCTVEAINRNHLNIIDDDENGNKMTSSYKAFTQIIITIEDLNDCKPMFNESSYEFTVVEGQKSHYQIGRVHAVDCDAELSNRMIRYSMRPSPGTIGQLVKLYVYISFEGIIYTHQTTDREQTPVLTFEVIATDTGNPPLSAVASVLIRILDTNDNSPVWIFPKQFGANSIINISQYSTVGLLIAQLKAVDVDEGLNGEIVYSIIHGNDDGLFEVDPMSGALYLVRSLHFLLQTMNLKSLAKEEVNNSVYNQNGEIMDNLGKLHEQVHSYRLLLKAQDRGTPPRHNTTVLYIAVLPSQFDKQIQTDRVSMESIHQHSEMKRHSDSNFLDIKRMDRDLIVMVVLIALTLIISIILIMTIFLVRCKNLLCITPFRRPNHNLSNRTNSNDNNNNNQFTLGNHTIQSNNHNGSEFIRGHWWNRSWNTKSVPKEYCINKSGELLSTSCQDMYRTNTLDHCPEFNLIRCVQNTTSTSPCDHILLKDSTYRTLDPDTFKHNNSPQPCNSSFSFNTSTNTTTKNNIINNINHNHNHNHNNKYNTITSLNNPIVNDYIIEMNKQVDESPYTLLKASDIKYFNKELIYQPLCSTSLTSRQFCLTPIIYEHNNNNNNKQINDITNNNINSSNNMNNEKSIIDYLNKSPNKLNITQQYSLTNFNSSQLNEFNEKNMKT